MGHVLEKLAAAFLARLTGTPTLGVPCEVKPAGGVFRRCDEWS